MTLKHLGSLSYSRHFATINNLFYLIPLQRIGHVFAPYVAFYVTGIHTFYTAIIIIWYLYFISRIFHVDMFTCALQRFKVPLA